MCQHRGPVLCKDHSDRMLSSGICFVSDESCVRWKQQHLMKHLGKRGQSIAARVSLIYHVIYHPELLRGTGPCAEPGGSSHARQGLSLADVTFHRGSYNLSASLTQSHLSERRGEKQQGCLAPCQDRMWS